MGWSTSSLFQVLSGKNQVIVCGDTDSLRQLCRTQIRHGDTVVDVGCSYGSCSHLCHEQGARVVGVDVSKEVIEQAQADLPNIR
jgi:2-polyprenyl-3-methyl-5-hydroxy-6-metoxy-1,4-benzoquinol methylase